MFKELLVVSEYDRIELSRRRRNAYYYYNELKRAFNDVYPSLDEKEMRQVYRSLKLISNSLRYPEDKVLEENIRDIVVIFTRSLASIYEGYTKEDYDYLYSIVDSVVRLFFNGNVIMAFDRSKKNPYIMAHLPIINIYKITNFVNHKKVMQRGA